jgi:wyosine [tRNA(Phe)-imidazoG37] synthetase (radical SAM superfamily)
MNNNKPLTFGPVNSRRFGISLGVDLSPNFKQCNFDCLYCELEKDKTVSKQSDSIEVNKYIDAVKEALIAYPETQVITITANGEPTLYPYLDELIDKLNEIKKDKKLLILSNAGLINDAKIAQTLRKIDIVKLSLDCATKECFKKLDRLDDSINYQDIIDGIISFSKIYDKELVLEVLFVDTLNNKQNEIEKIYDILKVVNPTRVDIGTIDRPPAYDVKPISFEELQAIAYQFEGLNISIAHRNKIKLHKSLSNESILNLLDKRPQTLEDIENLLDKPSKKLFDTLLEENKIITKNQAGVIFYAKA